LKSKNRKQSINPFFWGITLAFFLFQLLPWLVKQGMFLDGLTYSAISRNLAMELGSAWSPHYTLTFHPQFYEHPPLVFILQSWFFRLLGDGLYVERIFTFLTAVFCAWGIYKTWALFEDKEKSSFAWLPIFFWISIPAIAFSFRNNMLDNVVSVFSLFAVYFISRAMREKKYYLSLIGAIFILGAFFSKGPVGLFPLILPVLYILSFKVENKGKIMMHFALLNATLFLGIFLLFHFIPESKENLVQYFNQQLLPAIKGEREIKTSNRLFILGQVFTSLAVPLLLILLIALFKHRSLTIRPHERQKSLYFFLIALSASLPLVVTLKQSRVYLLPSLPFYVMALSYFFLPTLKDLLLNKRLLVRKYLKIVQLSFLVLLVAYTIFSFQRYDRDENLIEDVKTLTQIIPEGSIISTQGHCDDWVLIAYLSRYGNISLDCQERRDYHLLLKKEVPDSDQFVLQKVELNLFKLYVKSR
jgi:4-amino-4-deoxy-L-arabinose transferase-like glycosyltransferase